MWIAAVIGNSRIHWAQCLGQTVHQVWHTPHMTASSIAHLYQTQFNFAADMGPELDWQPSWSKPLWVASVVPEQTALFQQLIPLHLITLDHIPLNGLYPTLGIDRAIALWGAICTWGAPALVIDAGTALTFTAVDPNQTLVGGAIAPGLGLMLRSLNSGTAALPSVSLGETLPARWSLGTPESIHSGVVYTAIATLKDFVLDWQRQYPESAIALTGGDSEVLMAHLHQQWPAIAQCIIHNPDLIFGGIASLRSLILGLDIDPKPVL